MILLLAAIAACAVMLKVTTRPMTWTPTGWVHGLEGWGDGGSNG